MSTKQRSTRRAAAALVLVAISVAAPAPPLAGGGRRATGNELGYRPPTRRPVSDGFRRSPNPFAAGNRGLEYRTAAGDPIRVIGEGTVTYAGRIAGRYYVTVTHPDGLRSSYSHLSRPTVRRGQQVRAGDVVGSAGAQRFHLGVRRGDLYLDPAALFAAPGHRAHAILVPDREP